MPRGVFCVRRSRITGLLAADAPQTRDLVPGFGLAAMGIKARGPASVERRALAAEVLLLGEECDSLDDGLGDAVNEAGSHNHPQDVSEDA